MLRQHQYVAAVRRCRQVRGRGRFPGSTKKASRLPAGTMRLRCWGAGRKARCRIVQGWAVCGGAGLRAGKPGELSPRWNPRPSAAAVSFHALACPGNRPPCRPWEPPRRPFMSLHVQEIVRSPKSSVPSGQNPYPGVGVLTIRPYCSDTQIQKPRSKDNSVLLKL